MTRARAAAVPVLATLTLAALAGCASDPVSSPATAPRATAPAPVAAPAQAPLPPPTAALPPPTAAVPPPKASPPPAAAAPKAVPASAPNRLAGDVGRGKDYFNNRCIKCHVKDGMGAPYVGIVGRKAGTVPGFDYSAALKGSGITWTEEMLERWLENPDVLVPGNLMGLKIRNPQLRADLVAYLKTRN